MKPAAQPVSSTRLSPYDSDGEPTLEYTVAAEVELYDDDEPITLPLPWLHDDF